MSAHDMSRAALRTRASIEHLSVGCAIEPGWQNGNPGLHRNVYLHQGGICMHSKIIFARALATAALLLLVVTGASAQETLSPNGELGKKLLFDTNLSTPVSYTHLRAHETDSYLVCRLLLEKKK